MFTGYWFLVRGCWIDDRTLYPNLDRWQAISLTHISHYLRQYPSDVIWWHKSWSELATVLYNGFKIILLKPLTCLPGVIGLRPIKHHIVYLRSSVIFFVIQSPVWTDNLSVFCCGLVPVLLQLVPVNHPSGLWHKCIWLNRCFTQHMDEYIYEILPWHVITYPVGIL